MKKNLKKIVAIVVVLGTFIGYVLSQKNSSANPVVASNETASSNNNANNQFCFGSS